MSNTENTLETLSNRVASALARVKKCGDEYHAAAIDAEVEMSIILEGDPKLAARWAEVMQAHHEGIAAW